MAEKITLDEDYYEKLMERLHILNDENNKLLDVINGQDVKIADLEKQIEKDTAHRIHNFNKNIEWNRALKKENAQAKEIISKLLTRLHEFTYTGLDCEECKEAEQFLKENEK